MVTFSCMAMSWVGSMARNGADSEEAQQEEEGGGGDAEEVERSPVLQILSQALSFDPLVHLTNNTFFPSRFFLLKTICQMPF